MLKSKSSKFVFGLTLATSLSLSASANNQIRAKIEIAEEATRPNILFAIADDASHFSAYGFKFVNTPNFDRVARDGVLFNNAFTSNPKCAPSRASILTGMHTWQLGQACNHFEFAMFPSPDEVAVYPNILKDNGYFIGATGKRWAPGQFDANAWGTNPAGPSFGRHTLVPPYSGIKNVDYYANFVDFLTQCPDDKPFYFWYGGMEPHRDYEAGSWRKAGKNLSDVEVPPYLPDDDIVKGDLLDYAVETEHFDSQLGLMLNELEKRGKLDNTIVVVTSDNGMPFPRAKGQMYEYDFKLPLAIMWRGKVPSGRIVDDLVSFIDFAPTFLDVAGIKKHPQMEGNSLLPILESSKSGMVATTETPVYMGKEIHDPGITNDKGYPVRCIRTNDYLYVRNFFPDRWPAGNPETGFSNTDASPTKSLILEQHARHDDTYFNLCFGKHPEEELYNIKKDPYCLNNLAYTDDYQQIKVDLWSKLSATLFKTNDPRILGQGDVFENYEPYNITTYSWEQYWLTAGQSVMKSLQNQQNLWREYVDLVGLKNPFSKNAKPNTNYDAFKNTTIQVIVDGNLQSFNTAPFMINNVLLTPINVLSDVGATISVNEETKQINITKGIVSISLKVDSTQANVADEIFELEAAVTEKDGTIMIPIQQICQYLDAQYIYNPNFEAAFIYIQEKI